MEWLLILLVGGLAAGLGVWASRPGEKTEKERESTGGPGSSPALPPVRNDRGKAVTLGEKAKQLKADLKDILDEAPSKVQAKGVSGKDEPRRHGKTPLKVTYPTDQIIGRASRFAHHRRALQNAELLVGKQKAQEALEVYERAAHRIADPEIQAKINTNIEDIKRWQAGFDLEEDDLRFPEIIVPLTLQNLALENLTQGIKTLSDSVVGKIGESIAAVTAMQMAAFAGGAGAPSMYSGGAAPTMFAGGPGSGGAGAGAGGGAPGGAGAAAGSGSGQAGAPGQFAPGSGAAQVMGDGSPQAILPVIPRFYPPSGEWLSDTGALGRDGGPTEAQPPGMKLGDDGEIRTDGWSDADFEREWEKFKNLPAQDRRSGVERRKGLERRTGAEAKRKDRRSGEDRRKKDLFKEREEFLKKLEEHKKKKKAAEKKKLPELPPVEMPLKGGPTPATEPAEEKEKKGATIEIQNATIQIGSDPEGAPGKGEGEGEGEGEKAEAGADKGAPKGEPPPGRMVFETAPVDLAPIRMPEGVPVEQAGGLPAEAGAPAKEETKADTNTGDGDMELPDIPGLDDEAKEEKPQVQEIRGVLELKPPEEDDAPFLTLTYDFTKIPDSFKLSRDYHTMEYAYYKYKPMLVKAQEFTRRKMLKNALNYYRVIKSQNIPPEFKRMINRNIRDITEYLEKFLMSRA